METDSGHTNYGICARVFLSLLKILQNGPSNAMLKVLPCRGSKQELSSSTVSASWY